METDRNFFIILTYRECVRMVAYRQHADRSWDSRVLCGGEQWEDGRPQRDTLFGYWDKHDAILAGIRYALREIDTEGDALCDIWNIAIP